MVKHRVFLLGSYKSGKSSLLGNLQTLEMSEYSKVKKTESPLAKHRLSFQEISGDMRMMEMMMQHGLPTASCICIVFDVSFSDSMEELPDFEARIKRYCKEGVLVFLVGNKIDKQRSVTHEEGSAYATAHGMQYAEVSAHEGNGIIDLRSRILNVLLQAEK